MNKTDHDLNEALIRLIFRLPDTINIDEAAFAIAVLSDPGLRNRIPELQNFSTYRQYENIVRRVASSKPIEPSDFKNPSDEAVAMIRSILSNQRLRNSAYSALDLARELVEALFEVVGRAVVDWR